MCVTQMLFPLYLPLLAVDVCYGKQVFVAFGV